MKTLILILLIAATTSAFSQTRNPIVERQRAYQVWLKQDMAAHPEKYRAPQQAAPKPVAVTNAAPVLVAAPVPQMPQRLRLVDGKLYDANRSVLWTNLTAKYVQSADGLAVMQADDAQILVRNFDVPKLMPGTRVPLRVLPIGETNWQGKVIGIYDCGTAPTNKLASLSR